MTTKIGYNGIPEPNKPRKLEEVLGFLPSDSQVTDNKPPEVLERQAATDDLFKSVASTYLKGRILQKGLAGMEPGAFITIDTESGDVIAAAKRLFPEESGLGKIITYSMFQKSVDFIYNEKWEVRRKYFNTDIPITGVSNPRLVSSDTSTNKKKGLFLQFLEGNGMVGALFAALAMSPFMADVFQTLSSEETPTKAVQLVKVVGGLALLLEIGIKAVRIIDLLKSLNVNIPNAEQIVRTLDSDPSARAKALKAVGVDPDDLKGSMEASDHRKLIDYTSEHYARYGGLVEPGGFLTIDHWIAYLNVAHNQLLLRGALNIADSYSERFSEIRESTNSPLITSSTQTERVIPKFQLSVNLASVTKSLRENSDTVYDEILNSFMQQITDQDICCLVSLFGAFKDTEVLTTMGAILRILAMDLSGEINDILGSLKMYVSNLVMGALFELVNKIDKTMQEALLKITKMFTVDIDGLEHCIGLLSIGWGVLNGVQVIYKMIKDLLKEISNIINDFGRSTSIGWSVAADRRYLLGIARILEVLAARLDMAKVCDSKESSTGASLGDVEIKDITAGDAVITILGKMPPNLNITNQEIEKYFPGPHTRTSERLKMKYGILDMQNSKRAAGTDCVEPLPKSALEEIINKFKSVLAEE